MSGYDGIFLLLLNTYGITDHPLVEHGVDLSKSSKQSSRRPDLSTFYSTVNETYGDEPTNNTHAVHPTYIYLPLRRRPHRRIHWQRTHVRSPLHSVAANEAGLTMHSVHVGLAQQRQAAELSHIDSSCIFT